MYKRVITTIYRDGHVTHGYYVGELLMNKVSLKQRPAEAIKYGCQMAENYDVEDHIVKSKIGRIATDHTFFCVNFN